ncbi:ATP-binding protein [Phycicoccus endophyticus]|uniref:ATP-binding protein n=1 Tax=Phycicoccus endophyticus TaxID=1690220 RepID=UPI0019A4E24B|nr:BTAD domain-containing putative transcriptional regulator [Phycicoccus endophyticus]GGL31116.1 hypothetical protein GCM10012283_11780 [Phycicoccus endophyticus]
MPSPPAPAQAPRLRLLDAVTWEGGPVPGGRTHALLAALADAAGRTVAENVLVEEVWGPAQAPANPTKALQVVVSRARAHTAPEVVERTGHGYRLGLPADQVDVSCVRRDAAAARAAAQRGDWLEAAAAALCVLGRPTPAPGAHGPLAELRADGDAARRDTATVLGRALSELGEHDEALPLLEASPVDEPTTVALLRSLAAVRGAPAALQRYDEVRHDLAERLGVDPGPALRAVHAELLAADTPVRSGVRHDPTSLVGREEDIRALRAAVRESRVVSVLGPGGLGKTRLANLLAREAEQPVVHVVELVGVTSPEDVVGEVGSALGVRDSVTGRRVLTPQQRVDLRARAAQALDTAPTLLVLDNCEHVVAAVADLVAYLVATCPRLRVVTTTRAPLAITAERVFPLAQLDDGAAAELFRQRARAARPGLTLEDEAVLGVVRRLDGLPLAVELAAARVRVMSVEDVARRLDDRFALLRRGDRSAPDRHATLLAVIDWSWNLLAPGEQRALRRLSVFHDGFSLAAADAVVGHDALEELQSLVDQSLLTVSDEGSSVRYRMLETVREFGRLRLRDAAEEAEAEEARLAWAADLTARLGERLWTREQVAAVRALTVEEVNLADCLRTALSAGDPWAVARLLSTLAAYWTIRGENVRLVALAGAVDAALAGWRPQPEQVDTALWAAAMVVMNTNIGDAAPANACLALLQECAERVTDPRLRGIVEVLACHDPTDADRSVERLDEAAGRVHHLAAVLARMWAGHHRENVGDPLGAIAEAEHGLALTSDDDGPWVAALLHSLLGTLHAQLGHHEEAVQHALAALPVLDALDAVDDAVQSRAMLAVHAMSLGRLEEAEGWLAQVDRTSTGAPGFGGAFVALSARAELALARGQVTSGLERYREAVVALATLAVPGLGGPNGLEPWCLYGESTATTAYAVHGDGDDGADLYAGLLAKAPAVLDAGRAHLDYPVAGLVLHALGAWALLRSAAPVEDAVRLLVLAERFAYPRFVPTMSPAHTDGVAEERAPGLADRVRAEYATATAPALLPAARAAVEAVAGPAHILRE